MLSSEYPGGVVCYVVSILIDASNIFRLLFSASVATWCFSDACVANSEASALDFKVRDMCVISCGGAGSGKNIHDVGRFLDVISIGIVVGSTLGSEVIFQESWCRGFYVVRL